MDAILIYLFADINIILNFNDISSIKINTFIND
jgi:hypothetical protein